MAKKTAEEETIINTNLKTYEAELSYGERKIVSTSEKGKTYKIKFTKIKPSAVYKIDGVIITEGDKCDKLVLVNTDSSHNKWIEIFVELKGKDVDHAIKQLKATVDKPIFQHSTIEQRMARIVAQSIPRNTGNSVVERARDYFSKKHIPFSCRSGCFEEVM